MEEDFIAWHYDKEGMFTVRSAYKIGLLEQLRSNNLGASSSHEEGVRALWKHIWSAPVPQKIRVFAWRLALDRLATQHNKHRRKIVPYPGCTICGHPVEDGFHATVACSKARALRFELRQVWSLPGEELFAHSGPDWLLLLLDRVDKNNRGTILLMLWRAWYLRNNVVHDKGNLTITGSVSFLQSYAESLLLVRQKVCDPKGKQVDQQHNQAPPRSVMNQIKENNMRWRAPLVGWAKINVDGAFNPEDGLGGLGIIIRDSSGKVLLSSWRFIRRCSSVLESELLACLEGLKLTAEWIKMPVILESDCAIAVERMSSKEYDRSQWSFLLREMKRKMALLSEVGFSQCRRNCNRVAHELAQLAKRTAHCAVWRDHAPSELQPLLQQDCIPVI